MKGPGAPILSAAKRSVAWDTEWYALDTSRNARHIGLRSSHVSLSRHLSRNTFLPSDSSPCSRRFGLSSFFQPAVCSMYMYIYMYVYMHICTYVCVYYCICFPACSNCPCTSTCNDVIGCDECDPGKQQPDSTKGLFCFTDHTVHNLHSFELIISFKSNYFIYRIFSDLLTNNL